MTIAYSSYDVSYTNRVPYITATEYSVSPTSMDTANLVPGGAQANATALIETIGRASSWIDQFVMGSYGTLAATQNIENARIWSSRDGTLRVHPRYWPILEIDAFSYITPGGGFANSASVTPAGNIWIEPQEFIVSFGGSTSFGSSGGFGGFGSAGVIPCTQYACTWSYVNGYPVSTLTASVAAGATSITPYSVVGIYPGTTLTLYDLPNDELIQVASSYTPGATTVPLVGTTAYAHASGVMVTNLPPAVKQAAILATTALIKQRGSGALLVDDMGAATKQQTGFSQGSGSDWAEAEYLLMPFKQQYVGY
jgi:hypothetical protein